MSLPASSVELGPRTPELILFLKKIKHILTFLYVAR